MLSIFTFFSCRAVLAHKGKIIPLSRDFTPETERQRVQLIVRITFIVVFQKVHNAEMWLFVCLFVCFFHASCIRQLSIHSFRNQHFFIYFNYLSRVPTTCACRSPLPNMHTTCICFSRPPHTPPPRASYHKCSVTGLKVVVCWLQKVTPKGVWIYHSVTVKCTKH